ncbi:MAG TPA: hypothetical protein DCL21_01700 [Alphaproteobacteria bacterium]|nr:hypothetical protein [Alphaproteobacteria bacterium]
MKYKVILTICSLILGLSSSIANAADGKYTLTYQEQNKWVAQKDIKPVRNAIGFLKNNDLKIKAICSSKDIFCKQRVEILNLIFYKQKVKQQISIVEKSTYIQKNKLILESVNLDLNKYSNLFINYKNKNIIPVEQSQTDIKNIIKKAEDKFLVKFKMYCQSVDQLCKNRFNYINDLIGKTLPYKYNFALYENSSLEVNQAQLVNHRHDYNINNPIQPAATNSKKENAKQAKQVEKLNYTNKANIIVFKKGDGILLESEKVKVENLILNSKTNKFTFTCNLNNDLLCQKRVHAIKNYALQNTSNIIEMYQLEKTTTSNYIIIEHIKSK